MDSIRELLVLDLIGASGRAGLSLRERRIAALTLDFVGDLLASIRPQLTIRVADRLTDSDNQLGVTFEPKSIRDFEESALRTSVDVLRRMCDCARQAQEMLDELERHGRLAAWGDLNLGAAPQQLSPPPSSAVWSSRHSPLERVLTHPPVAHKPHEQESLVDTVWRTFQQGGATAAATLLTQAVSLIDERVSAQVAEIQQQPDFVALRAKWTLLEVRARTQSGLVAVIAVSADELRDDLRDRRTSCLLRKISRLRIAAHHPINVYVESGLAPAKCNWSLRALQSWGDLRGIKFVVAESAV